MSLQERYAAIVTEATALCEDAGRDPSELRIVAVSKTVGWETVGAAIAAGIHDFGENRPDSLVEKQQRYPEATWHFIGNIQSRRIPEIVACATLIHSLYQSHHVAAIEKAAAALNKVQNVLLEVNISGEASKSGLAPEEVEGMLASCVGQDHIKVCGLMTMAPQGDPLVARSCFESLAQLAEEMQSNFASQKIELELHELSMGMSEDWREAIAAGATIVRIGRAIFEDTF